MNIVYFALDAMSMVILLMLLYANLFEQKQKTRKKMLFTHLLVATAVMVLSDAVTWLDLGWSRAPALFFVLITLTYLVPMLILSFFLRYLHAHLAEHTEVDRRPFTLIHFYGALYGIIVLILCFNGRMFDTAGGIFTPGPAEIVFYVLYLVALVLILCAVLINGRKLGTHDFIGALFFCLIPLSILVFSAVLDINVNVPGMTVNMLVIYLMLQSESQSKLIYESNIDELTGVHNRRAYEDDMLNYPDVPTEPDFIYACIDINNLKQTNDTYGHDAGDELIRGVVFCLKQTFGNYGKIYRTGGDEFVSMFFADELHLKQILDDLYTITHEWRGTMVPSLAVSVGCAAKREFPTRTVVEIAKIADQRMYADKSDYYSRHGIDRRGQSEAHKALCALYTKIMKIDLTADTFTIINMDEAERSEERGFSTRISEWLESFADRGFVHPDDVADYRAKLNLDYLRDYFRSDKTSFTLFYRRKYDDVFKQVMLELVPATDYTPDHQTLFLYVKDIDK